MVRAYYLVDVTAQRFCRRKEGEWFFAMRGFAELTADYARERDAEIWLLVEKLGTLATHREDFNAALCKRARLPHAALIAAL